MPKETQTTIYSEIIEIDPKKVKKFEVEPSQLVLKLIKHEALAPEGSELPPYREWEVRLELKGQGCNLGSFYAAADMVKEYKEVLKMLKQGNYKELQVYSDGRLGVLE